MESPVRETTSPRIRPASIRRRFVSQGGPARRSRGEDGFTLIEILLVLAIITLMMSLGLPAIQAVTGQRINSTTRKLTGLVRSVRNDAILLNLIHRVVINFDDQTWWIESQKKFSLLEDPEEIKKKKKKKDEPVEDTNFTFAQKYTKEPIKVPSGVTFSGVLMEKEGFINKGIAYIFFYPNGFSDQTILYLNKEGNEHVFYSMILRPNSGKVDLVSGKAEGF